MPNARTPLISMPPVDSMTLEEGASACAVGCSMMLMNAVYTTIAYEMNLSMLARPSRSSASTICSTIGVHSNAGSA